MKRNHQLIIIALCFIGGLWHPDVYVFASTFIISFPLTFLAVYGFRYYETKVKPGQISDSLVLATLLSAILAVTFLIGTS